MVIIRSVQPSVYIASYGNKIYNKIVATSDCNDGGNKNEDMIMEITHSQNTNDYVDELNNFYCIFLLV